ncbi:MAG: pitrilysin family protein [Pyrinomonadaceae bacterium]
MRRLILVLLVLCVSCSAFAQGNMPSNSQQRKVFPYAYTVDDLPNKLRLITIPTDYPNLVALYIVVGTGSRNEVEAGKSGYAHLFEHLMFRGSKNFSADQRDAILKRAGASSNAYTTDDRTVYHEVFSKEDLPQIMEIEADRFLRLTYPETAYKTETRAVLGEYNKNSASPFSKMEEVLRATAYNKHTYTHTTMGFIKDIEDMPNQYQYSLEFYRRYYRPEYTTIIIAGDVTRDQALQLTRKNFGEWQTGNYMPEIPGEPEQTAPRTANIDWPTPTLPIIAVAFRGPAYSDEKLDKAALDLLASIAFGQNSELFQRLVLKEQKVDFVGASFGDQLDPELFTVYSRVKDPKDVAYVQEQILQTFKRFTTETIPQAKLDATRSNARYSFAHAMDSSEAIASAIAPYVALRRTPETLNKVFAMYDRITPEDMRTAARRYFVDRNRTIVTLQTKQGATTANTGGTNQ